MKHDIPRPICSKAEGLTEVIPDKLPRTNLWLASREGDQTHLFEYKDTRQPTDVEVNCIMSLVISKLTHINMSNHFYTFNSKLFS